jgi:hypothetical protein
VQEGKSIVPQECDVGVVNESREVERVSEESSQEITRATGEERQKEELHHVEMEIERKEGPVGHLYKGIVSGLEIPCICGTESYVKTISKFQLLLLPWLCKQALSSTSSSATGAPQTSQRGGSSVRTE